MLHNIALKFNEPTTPVNSELDKLIRMEEMRREPYNLQDVGNRSIHRRPFLTSYKKQEELVSFTVCIVQGKSGSCNATWSSLAAP